MARRPRTFQHPLSQQKIQKILELLAVSPMTSVELQEEMFQSSASIWMYTTYLRGEYENSPGPRRIRICGWTERGQARPQYPIFGLGDKPDAKKPKRTQAYKNAYARAWRRKMRALGINPKTGKRIPSVATVERDPMLAAFFGPSNGGPNASNNA